MSGMSRGVRQNVVSFLADRNMPVRDIADELGVSPETVRRDLHNRPPAAEEEPAPDEAPDEAPGLRTGPEGLILPASLTLGQDLRLIASAHRRPAEDVAEELIHWHADRIREKWQRQMDAAAS
ncbi:DeoR family transcriptional regulator [Streptomyces sp. cg28]|uniref:DeoR family transcriptional regulator n=1 Tax=Streptomyces sp. cg28 TaxID=3403457 RepID=UPI003B21C210